METLIITLGAATFAYLVGKRSGREEGRKIGHSIGWSEGYDKGYVNAKKIEGK